MKDFKLFSFLLYLFFLTAVGVSKGRTGWMKVEDISRDNKMAWRPRRSIPNSAMKWPRGIVPYIIDPSFKSQEGKDLLQKAFDYLANYTCVKWLVKTPELMAILGHNNYVRIIAEDSEENCWSDTGMDDSGEQGLSIGPGCWDSRTVFHELLHTMGVVHVQTRSDRDNYVDVKMENLEEGNDDEFNKEETTNYVPYDFESVMHYGLYDFGKDDKQVIYLKDPNLEFLIENANKLTFYDVADVLLNYKCSAHCAVDDVGRCGDFGILNHKCECNCMKGFTGEECDDVYTGPDCGGFYDMSLGDEALTITSPNYPSDYPKGELCRWVISAKNGSLPRVVIEDLELVTEDNSDVCKDWLEVQYNLPGQSGLVLCGKVQNETYVSSKDSGGKLILTFESDSEGDNPTLKGFRAKVDVIGPGSR